MFRGLRLKQIFLRMNIYAITCAFIITIIVEIILVLLLNQNNFHYTAYYSNRLPEIEKKILENKEHILRGLEFKIQSFDEAYQGEYVNLKGENISGEKLLNDEQRKSILKNINKNNILGKYGYKYVIIEDNSNVLGVYVIKYPFGFFKNNEGNSSVLLINIFIIISPILILGLCLFVFIKLAYNVINTDIQDLKNAVVKIENHDLNFQIINNNNNEIGSLARSINGMKNALKSYIEANIKIEEEKEIMIKTAAHEIKTPLTIISGQAEMISEISDNNISYEKYIQSILRNCDRIYRLTRKLNTVYHFRSNNISVNLKHENIKIFIDNKMDEISVIAKCKNVKVERKYELYNQEFLIDTILLSQITDNIFSNSLRFVDEGDIIGIKVEEINNFLYFTCYDTGSGFSNEDISKAFDMFYRGEEDKEKDNSGLGLYICQKVVEKLGGEIKAYNNDNGAVIEFNISVQAIKK